MRSIRLLIPLESCNIAATYLIQALGGEEHAAKIAGGTRWWQVRGLKGIDANWIAVKKDWEEAKKERRRRKTQSTDEADDKANGEAEETQYSPEMDPMRCMLYIHGGEPQVDFPQASTDIRFTGGYCFGSVDQERFCIQRYAR